MDVKSVSFGIALEAMKIGHLFRRQVWDDSYQALYVIKGIAPKALLDAAAETGALHQTDVSLFLENEGSDTVRFPVLALQTKDGTEIGWVPGPRDIVANDWIVVA